MLTIATTTVVSSTKRSVFLSFKKWLNSNPTMPYNRHFAGRDVWFQKQSKLMSFMAKRLSPSHGTSNVQRPHLAHRPHRWSCLSCRQLCDETKNDCQTSTIPEQLLFSPPTFVLQRRRETRVIMSTQMSMNGQRLLLLQKAHS